VMFGVDGRKGRRIIVSRRGDVTEARGASHAIDSVAWMFDHFGSATNAVHACIQSEYLDIH
jgi:hypothetical protein